MIAPLRTREGAALACALCFEQLWVFWMLSHSHTGGYSSVTVRPMLFMFLFALAAGALAPRLSVRKRAARAGDCAAGAFGAVGMVAIELAGGSVALRAAASAAVGGACAWLSLRAGMRLASRRLSDALSLVLVSGVAYSAVAWLSWLLSDWGTFIAGCAAPVVVALCLRPLPPGPVYSPEMRYFKDGSRELVLGPFACALGLFLVCSGASGLLRADYGSFAYGPGASLAVTSLCHAAVIALFLFWLFCAESGRSLASFHSIMKAAALLVAAALVLAGLLGSSPMLQVLTFPAFWMLRASYSVLLADAAQHADGCPARWVALGQAGYGLTNYANRLVSYSVAALSAGSGPALTSADCIALLGILAAVVILTFRPQDYISSQVFRDIDSLPVPSRASDDAYEAACARYARSIGLSDREAEVMLYVARGYTKPFIAERLSISDNTVRTHVRRIYEKAGVHSRRELQEKVSV